MLTFTRWVLAHKAIVAIFWLVVTLGSFAAIPSAINSLSPITSFPGQAGFQANSAILQNYGNGADNPVAVAVVTLPAGTTVDSAGIKEQITSTLNKVQQAAPGVRIASYASTSNRLFVSQDGRTTFALIYEAVDPVQQNTDSSQAAIQQALVGATIAGQPVHLTGVDILQSGGGSSNGPNALLETLIGGVGALIILGFVFRASLLALLPLLVATTAIPTTFLLIWGLSTFTTISFIVEFLVALIGLGVAIDYALLIVMRWREERAGGAENILAVERAMQTAGSSVIFSGTTVAIGLLALALIPVPFLQSVGYGGLLIPLVSVIVALTLLPVVLATLGPRLEWPRLFQGKKNSQSVAQNSSRFWTWWGKLIVKRRWSATITATIILIMLLIPAFSLNMGNNPQPDALASSGDAYEGLKALEQAGIGTGIFTPFEVLVTGADPQSVTAQLTKVAGVRGAIAPTGADWHSHGTALVIVLPDTNGKTSDGLVVNQKLRDIAQASFPVGQVQIGGNLPQNADFITAVYGNFPYMVAVVILVTYLLLVRAFRSLILPLKAVLLVLISVGTALGFMTLVWQNGCGSELIWGIKATGTIAPFIPVLLFAFLFGISMDYEVFMLARMREEYDQGFSTNQAVIRGIGSTGRLVTSGGLILFLAFVSLSSGPDVTIKTFATGLAVGILLDATIIRMLLVPALISLLGSWNWWLPTLPARWLRVQPSLIQSESERERASEGLLTTANSVLAATVPLTLESSQSSMELEQEQEGVAEK